MAGILLRPRAEWGIIGAERATVGSIYRYVVILAAIPAVGSAFGLAMIGGFRRNGVWLMRQVISHYALSLISVYLMALIIDALAPAFGSQKGRLAALKVAAYSATAYWVAGVFLAFISWGTLVAYAGGLYSIYLVYLGLPALMKGSEERAVTYTIFAVVAVIAVSMGVGVILSEMSGAIETLAFYHGHHVQ